MMNKDYPFETKIAEGIVKEVYFNMKAEIPSKYISFDIRIEDDTPTETIEWIDRITSNDPTHFIPIVQSDQKFNLREVKTHEEWDDWLPNLHGRYQFYFTVDEQSILFEKEEDLVLYNLTWMT